MPAIAKQRDSSLVDNRLLKDPLLADVRSEVTGMNVHSSCHRKRKLRSSGAADSKDTEGVESARTPKRSAARESSDSTMDVSPWNTRDPNQMRTVKEALHVSTMPSVVVCREEEQMKVLEFCKECVEKEKAGCVYVSGCPGTGKSLSMSRVGRLLLDWTKEAGLLQPDVLDVNCTSLSRTSEIFSKIISAHQISTKTNSPTSQLQLLQTLYSQKPKPLKAKMMLVIADEMDYLITKDRAVLHDLFMLTTFPFSRFILVGIANAIDLADRFLPRLQMLNCKPLVVTYCSYSMEQIIKILHERLKRSHVVFQPQALELCARKVSASSGDMRKALSICRIAIDILEAELLEPQEDSNSPTEPLKMQDTIVRIDHMARALSRTFKSSVVDTIQLLPQHQQVILCSAVKLFRGRKKDTTVGELYEAYRDVCKSSMIPASNIMEFSNMCGVLNDQGLLKLGQSRQEKQRRLSLKVDEADVTFALQGVRFFQNCLQQS
ncbi:hypothetical protein MLD38_011538 [Melastoma candidum]|uniref:Uncharacterized protein n=1 Tax=Melastoma candidum TaxID=119954 RepID=A0ACB9R2T2_9MYRT|nr:hypothetical protein MLD38_011538 [Melastoma candidum]